MTRFRSEERRTPRPPRRPRVKVPGERGIYTEIDSRGRTRYGVCFADRTTGRLKRFLLSADVASVEEARDRRATLLAGSEHDVLLSAFAVRHFRDRQRIVPASWDREVQAVKAFIALVGDLRMREIEPKHITAYKTHRLSIRKPGTVIRDVAAIDTILRSAMKARLITVNPCIDRSLGCCIKCGAEALPDMRLCLEHQLHERMRPQIHRPKRRNTKFTRAIIARMLPAPKETP